MSLALSTPARAQISLSFTALASLTLICTPPSSSITELTFVSPPTRALMVSRTSIANRLSLGPNP